ncbi:polysaccharide deacetylase family protein [Intrasporangium sp. YIM S08009]|uniref:polysaccharide deacetylase family protein n=1 Tax=Intrasporangium zincisolvens TaxID=3080018 RepID=UPI002B059CB1|nr:polysaccharide deacetylase family protein [Intrasporangium sp. YIM S08009]
MTTDPEGDPRPDAPHASDTSDASDADRPATARGPRVDRRVFLAGVTVSLALGAAACSSPGATDATSDATATSEGPPAARPGSSSASASTPSSSSSATGSSPTTPPSGRVTPAVLQTDGTDVVHGPSSAPQVALTFHGAGDPSLTRRALALLARHDARVTVFAVGTWLSANPDLGRAVVDAGHDLGNHTWSHRTMPRLDAATARTEVARGAEAVAAVAGSSPLLFRPSGTPTSTATIRAAARAAGYHRCVSYSVDPRDYADPGAAAVTARTLSAVRPGSIVSLHLGHPGTVAALPSVLSGLASRGLHAVTLTELLA